VYVGPGGLEIRVLFRARLETRMRVENESTRTDWSHLSMCMLTVLLPPILG
jgi:hypothetical protein